MVRRAIPRDTWGDELWERVHVLNRFVLQDMPGMDEGKAFFPRDFARLTLIEFRI